MPDPENPKQGDTYRTRCGAGRITYNPEFYRSRAWSTFYKGTACHAFTTFAAAEDHLVRYHGTKKIQR